MARLYDHKIFFMRFLVISGFTCLVHVHSQTHADVKALLTHLFTNQSYDKLVRPSLDQSEYTFIYIEFHLYGIIDLDEVQQKLTTAGYVLVSWSDELLTWDSTEYGNIEYIHVPQENIWLPDIALRNGFEDLEGLGSEFMNVLIDYEGFVYWKPFHVFESRCNLDSTYFPFEKQSCNIEFEAWTLDSDDVYLSLGDAGIDTHRALGSNGIWDVVSSSATSFSDDGEPRIRFTIIIKRKPLFYIINIILPIILLSVLNIFTFLIPADMGERMGYSVTVWLSFAVFLTVISGSLPKSSDTVPIISIYIMTQLVVGTVCVLLSAWESKVIGQTDDVPIPLALRRLNALIKSKPTVKKNLNNISVRLHYRQKRFEMENGKVEQKHEHDEVTTRWVDAISALDVLCFWIFSAILLIATLCLFLITWLKG